MTARSALVLLGATLVWPAHAGADPAVESFAVVVGTTRADRPGQSTLRYADDDAARWHELLTGMGVRAELLATLDDDTQSRHPETASVARIPSRAELANALERTRAAIADAKRRGARTAFWFVFAGHGDVGENHEGYLVLHDGRFTRTDLYANVIAASNADVNHLVLDACRAWFMVSRRGGAPAAAIRELLDQQALEKYPNTGVLLATTESAEVHEWDRYRAGVFSHEVRSALRGGADVDDDGRIGYLEVAAFITAANAKVTDPRGKLSIAAIPPAAHRAAALVDWSTAPEIATALRVLPARSEAMWLDDARGVRLADVHPTEGQPVTLRVPRGSRYVLRGAGWETSVEAASATVELDARTGRDPGLASRGVADSLDRGLFAQAFGADYYEGFVAANPRGLWPSAPPIVRRTRTWRSHAGWGAASGAVAAGAVAFWQAEEARSAEARYERTFGTEEEISSLRASAERRRRNAWVAAGASAALAGASGTFFLSERRALRVSIGPERDVTVGVAWSFGESATEDR